jgi:ABC-2 type transport system permease protein
MSSLRRILSQTYKTCIIVKGNHFRLLDVTIWPLVTFLSVILFAGFAGAGPSILGVVVVGSIGWRLLFQFQMEPSLAVMDEYWDHSLEHLMVAPLRIAELLIGGLLTGLLKSVIAVTILLSTAFALFGYAPALSGTLLAGIAAIFCCGAVFAILGLGVVVLKGNQSYAYVFATSDVLAAFSGVYYPTTAFPPVVHAIVQALPTTHAFDLLKESVGVGTAQPWMLILTLAVWFVGASVFCAWAFRKARREGRLAQMR